jgi:hypothetical protein
MLTVWNSCSSKRALVQAAVAVQRDGQSHKLNVRVRAHWGCHDLTALNPPEVLLQPQTAPDGPATEPKRNYPRMNLRHYLLKGHGPRRSALKQGAPWQQTTLNRERWPQ